MPDAPKLCWHNPTNPSLDLSLTSLIINTFSSGGDRKVSMKPRDVMGASQRLQISKDLDNKNKKSIMLKFTDLCKKSNLNTLNLNEMTPFHLSFKFD